MIQLRSGRFGPYVTDGTTNASLRRGDSEEEITLERVAELLAERRAAGPAAPLDGCRQEENAAKKAPAKKTTAKKTAAKKVAATKSTAKKAPAKKVAASKSVAKKTATKRTASVDHPRHGRRPALLGRAPAVRGRAPRRTVTARS